MHAPSTPCPAGCGREQKNGKFLCFPCWRALPGVLRAAVTNAWDHLQSIDPHKDSIAYRTAVRAYRVRREESLRFLKDNPAKEIGRRAAERLFGG